MVSRGLWPFNALKTPLTPPHDVSHDSAAAPPAEELAEELKQKMREWEAAETKRKASDFDYVRGAKLHKQDAPWPFAFNREYLEVCAALPSVIESEGLTIPSHQELP